MLKFKLHFNKTTGAFSIRRSPERSIVWTGPKRAEVPFIGDTVALAPRVHILVTKGDYLKGKEKKRPVLSVAVTRFPFIHLLIKRVKEALK